MNGNLTLAVCRKRHGLSIFKARDRCRFLRLTAVNPYKSLGAGGSAHAYCKLQFLNKTRSLKTN